MNVEVGDLIVGVLMIVLSLMGLFLAAGAHDNEMYVFGLSLVGWGIVFVFGLVRRHYDRLDVARVSAHPAGVHHV